MPRKGRSTPLCRQPWRRLTATTAKPWQRWTWHLGGPDVEIEDAVQEIFLVVSRQMGQLPRRGALLQLAVRHHPQGGGQPPTATSLAFLGVTRARARSNGLPSTSLDPYAQLEQQQARQQFYRVLDQLPEKYRTVLVMFELEDMSTQEIADIRHTKLNTVKVQLHRARENVPQSAPSTSEQGRAMSSLEMDPPRWKDRAGQANLAGAHGRTTDPSHGASPLFFPTRNLRAFKRLHAKRRRRPGLVRWWPAMACRPCWSGGATFAVAAHLDLVPRWLRSSPAPQVPAPSARSHKPPRGACHAIDDQRTCADSARARNRNSTRDPRPSRGGASGSSAGPGEKS